jgi:hypothetical protein
VTVVRTDPVSALVNVTVTFGMTAPDGSVTVPLTAPVEAVCASKAGRQTKSSAKITKEILLVLINLSPIVELSHNTGKTPPASPQNIHTNGTV